jgi:hypothetical protein
MDRIRQRRLVLAAAMLASQTLFLWTYLAATGLEQMAAAGEIAFPGGQPRLDAAYRYAAEWRHGLTGLWPVYVPGFFAAALAVWFWSIGRPIRELLPELLLIMLAALAIAAALSPYGTALVIADFAASAAIVATAPPPAAGARGMILGFYSLLCWNAVVLAAHRALWGRSLRPLVIPVVLDAILILVRPFTFDDLVSTWTYRALAGQPAAVVYLLAVPALATLMVYRQLAWERRRAPAIVLKERAASGVR